MPWRPDAVGQKANYGVAWRKQRLALLKSEPLCRLCLATGRTVAATVADHILPLADGGTNETANLQPLCKRCHDAIKTPADKKAREAVARQAMTVILMAPCASSDLDGVVDLMAIRSMMAGVVGWNAAHALAIAALEGMASAAKERRVTAGIRVAIDDDVAARLVSGRYDAKLVEVPVTIESARREASGFGDRSEQDWLALRLQRWYASRVSAGKNGGQVPHGRSE